MFSEQSKTECLPRHCICLIKRRIVVLLSYDGVKNDPSALQAMEDEIALFKRFDCYDEVSSDMVSVNANIISTRWVIPK
jgi:hypothetical protein